MAIVFALIGVALIIYSFRLKGLPIMTTSGLFIGCLFLGMSVAWLGGSSRSSGPDCYIDWDGRSNSEICD